MECANCGRIGHTFRDCREPVMSYGICAVKFIESVPHYLLIRRRDSISYVEFLRGKYKLDNRDYIQLLINGMTDEERVRLLAQPFDRLWELLWNSQNTRQFRNEYELAKRMFEAIKNTGDIYGKLLIRYIEDAVIHWLEPEWGFPKGRRTLHEREIECAIREFEEETGLSRRIVHVLSDEAPLIEEYIGTNEIAYKQIYFVGSCASDSVAEHQPSNRVMNREVGDIGFYRYEDAMEKIRPTNPDKRRLLEELNGRITTGELGDKLRTALEWTTT